MPNPIKYTTGSETDALKKGNFYIGTGDVGKGPSDVTGYYQGISPSEGGYVIYMNNSGAPGDLSYHNAPTDNDLITFTNNLAGQSYTTVQECLVYYAGQTDKVVLNRDYEGIVTDGLVLNLDAGFTPSYPKNGTTWYDVSGESNNGVLINGPTFDSGNGGSIVFDGTNDYAEVTARNTNLEFQPTEEYSCMVFYKSPPSAAFGALIANMVSTAPYTGWDIWFNNAGKSNTIAMHLITSWSGNAIKVAVDYNYSTYANQWVCFGYTYDGSCPTNETDMLNSVDFYLNGTLYTSGKQKGESDSGGTGFDSSSETITYNPSQRFRVASRWKSGSWDYGSSNSTGIVLVYNRKLTSSEMLQNYNAQKGRFGL